MDLHIATKELPDTLKTALRAAGYHRADIRVRTGRTVSCQPAVNKGNRSFLSVVNLSTGATSEHKGSWGGFNPFVSEQELSDRAKFELERGFAAIEGETGYKTYMTVIVHPDDVQGMLPAADETLTDRERRILAVFAGIKGGHRKTYLEAGSVTKEEIESLAARGYLAINKRGSVRALAPARNERARNTPSNWEPWT